jgi:hypothetical protein
VRYPNAGDILIASSTFSNPRGQGMFLVVLGVSSPFTHN